MTTRPTNHVTREIDAFRSGPDRVPELPVLERRQIERLEELYPPRCLGRSETVEEHLRYCGFVELVGNLRQRFEQNREDAREDELDEAERAS